MANQELIGLAERAMDKLVWYKASDYLPITYTIEAIELMVTLNQGFA